MLFFGTVIYVAAPIRCSYFDSTRLLHYQRIQVPSMQLGCLVFLFLMIPTEQLLVLCHKREQNP